MRPGDPPHTFFLADPVQIAAGAAIGIGNGDALKAARPPFADRLPHGVRNFLRPVVQDRRQAGKRDVIEVVDGGDGADFARQSAAGDDQHAGVFVLRRSAVLSCRAIGDSGHNLRPDWLLVQNGRLLHKIGIRP